MCGARLGLLVVSYVLIDVLIRGIAANDRIARTPGAGELPAHMSHCADDGACKLGDVPFRLLQKGHVYRRFKTSFCRLTKKGTERPLASGSLHDPWHSTFRTRAALRISSSRSSKFAIMAF